MEHIEVVASAFGLYLFAYLLGTVPTGYLLGKWRRGIDLRKYGSGNIGTTNVAHHVGRPWASATLLYDVFIKGAAPIFIAVLFLGWDKFSLPVALVPVAALIGHNWSPFLSFQGGRGVSVIIGALLALSPFILATAAAIFVVGWFITKNSGLSVLSSLTSAILMAGFYLQEPALFISTTALVFLMVLKRLLGNGGLIVLRMTSRQTCFYRLFYDRDIPNQEEWVHRSPTHPSFSPR